MVYIPFPTDPLVSLSSIYFAFRSVPPHSGCLGREKAKKVLARLAPLLKCRRLHGEAEEAMEDGRFDDAENFAIEV